MTVPTEFVEKLRSARSVAVLTGAGISAESGVPTFRDAQTGLWAKYDAYELATPEAFARNPKLVWDWYAWRRQLVAEAQPNPGHFAVAQMQDLFDSFDLSTQNVDRLHARAGSRDVTELHGSIARIRCSRSCGEVKDFDAAASPPLCRHCGAPLRPDLVWFGEQLPADALARAEAAAAGCDVFFSIGTSAQVFPAADLPLIALQAGATVVEINPTETALTPRVHFALRGKSGMLLPELVGLLA